MCIYDYFKGPENRLPDIQILIVIFWLLITKVLLKQAMILKIIYKD